MKNIKIGLFGFGVVGEGIYQVLSQKKQLGAEVKKVVIKQAEKERNAPKELFSIDANSILDDPEIDLVVELIDDAEAAKAIVSSAIRNGKSVISANKKMIAENHIELIELSKKKGVSFLYEAAVCGSIPIIRNLEEYFDNDLLKSVEGIVNGSTNYILSKMLENNEPYDSALKNAQEKGFAESDPTLDVEGVDAAYKLSIIALHAFGKNVPLNSIAKKGITALHPSDFKFAKEKKQVIKLIAKCNTNESGEIDSLSVLPQFIDEEESLARTNNEYNGVLIESALADQQFLCGKGAGRYPTSSAVLSDISAYRYNYQYEYKKGIKGSSPQNKSTGKFYLGFDRETQVDIGLFELIEERFIGKERSYIIGDIQLNKLLTSNVLSRKDISLISCN